jgi:hypothetical protein
VEERTHKQEFLWYLLAFVLAAFFRLVGLGSLPLGSSEASQAFQALETVKGASPLISGAPVYLSLTSLLFSIFPANNFWALFWPATFGTALVFTPLLFKKWLGRTASIILALLLAIDPGLVAVSRRADGSMIIAIVCLLAALGFMANKRSIWFGISLGLFLLGGVSSWPALIVAAVLVLIYLLSRSKEEKAHGIVAGLNWKASFIACVATFTLVGTMFLMYPTLINGWGNGVYQYFSGFTSGDGASLKVMLLSLPVTELLVLPLAIWGWIAGIRRKDLLTELLGYGVLLFGLLAALNQSRQVVDWAWTLLPLIVLATLGLKNLLDGYVNKELAVTAAQAVLTVVLIVFSVLNLMSLSDTQPTDTVTMRNTILEIVLPLVFLLIVTLLLTFGWSAAASRQGLLFGLGALLLFVSVGAAWKAAGLGPRPESELWRSDPLPSGEEMLLKSATRVSLTSTGLEYGSDIAVIDVSSAELMWSLRRFDEVSEVDSIGTSDYPSIIVGSKESVIGSANYYQGLEIYWTTSVDYDNMTAQNWLKWFVTREAPTTTSSLFLWVRNDLFTNEQF